MDKSRKVKFLDHEEEDLQKAIDNMNVSIISKPDAKAQQKFKLAAANFVKKEAKMNIRIDPLELEAIKKRAEIEGLKYQTFVKSVIHKYITGQLIEKKS